MSFGIIIARWSSSRSSSIHLLPNHHHYHHDDDAKRFTAVRKCSGNGQVIKLELQKTCDGTSTVTSDLPKLDTNSPLSTTFSSPLPSTFSLLNLSKPNKRLSDPWRHRSR